MEAKNGGGWLEDAFPDFNFSDILGSKAVNFQGKITPWSIRFIKEETPAASPKCFSHLCQTWH